jgi:hypothetical protein
LGFIIYFDLLAWNWSFIGIGYWQSKRSMIILS